MKRPRIFSPKHKSVGGKAFNGRKHIDAMYDYHWESIYTKKFLEVNPVCYSCGAKATVVDHLQPHRGDERLFKKTDNHIQLCEKCHNTVTAKFDTRGKPVTEKIMWFNEMRAKNGVTVRVKVLPRYE